MIHELKILPEYFNAVKEGIKNFEIRKDDRNFKEGDTLILKEFLTAEMYYGLSYTGNTIKLPIESEKDKNLEGVYTGREIAKEISYVLKGGKYGLEEGYCIASLKQEGIVLKNIDLTGITGNEQLKKVKEEFREFTDSMCEFIASEGSVESRDHFIEEYFDLLQSGLGLLDKFGISADEVQKYYPKHLEKLKSRPRNKLCGKCGGYSLSTDGKEKLCVWALSRITDENTAKECKCYEELED